MTAAHMPGEDLRPCEPFSRRTGNPVRRNSRLPGQEPWAPITWRVFDRGLRALKRFVVHEKHARPGRKLPVSQGVLLSVYDHLGRLAANNKGRVEPSIAGIAERLGHTTRTIVRALAWLKSRGWLDWLRRMVRVDAAALRGPAMRQITNAYRLKPIPDAALALLPAQAQLAPPPEDAEVAKAERAAQVREMDLDPRAPSPLGAALNRLGQAVSGEAAKPRPPRDVP